MTRSFSSTRRRFLERMGLTAAAPLLLSAADQLIGRAMGATASRRIAIFAVIGESMPVNPPWGLVPDGFSPDFAKGGPVDATGVNWSAMWGNMNQFRQKSVLVDGVAMNLGKDSADHGDTWGILSGVKPLDNPNPMHAHIPGGITIDQHVAKVISKDVAIPALYFGVGGGFLSDSHASTFASGAQQPIPYVGRPSILFSRIVGQKGTASVPGGAANPSLADQKLLSLMRDDIGRLQRNLAAEERTQLDAYLAAIDDFDRKNALIRASLSSGACKDPMAPVDGAAEQRVQAMFQISSLALRCGLTNVVGISIGNTIDTHDDLTIFKDWFKGRGGHPAAGVNYSADAQAFFQQVLNLLATTMTDLGPLLDNTFVMVAPANATADGSHHGDGRRTAVMLFDGAGKLKAGARYMRYQLYHQRTMADVLTTAANVIGAPVDKMNGAGTGIIPELLA